MPPLHLRDGLGSMSGHVQVVVACSRLVPPGTPVFSTAYNQSSNTTVPFTLPHAGVRNDNIHEPQHDKTNKMAVCLAKTQISLGIHPV